MERKHSSAVAVRGRRRRNSLLWSLGAAILVIALIWTEQVALLYVLATLSVAALLVVVAFSDLGASRRTTQAPPLDDAAAVGDSMNTAGATARTSSRR